jgi:hypothetical protein
MNSSRPLSFSVICLVAFLTVPPKLKNESSIRLKLSHNLQETIINLLARAEFETNIGDRLGFFVIDAQRNNCRLQIDHADAGGYNVAEIQSDAPRDARVVFEYRGELWKNHPTFRASISQSWSMLKWSLGLDDVWFPVISISALGPCSIETLLPWDKLAAVQAS